MSLDISPSSVLSDTVVNSSEYFGKGNITYLSKAKGKRVNISPAEVIGVVTEANKYLHSLEDLFKQLSFDIYVTLGQRNVSGFVGEVFPHVFATHIDGFVINPHADGRPDLLDVSSKEAHEYFRSKCFSPSNDGSIAPNKSQLTPFKYGGIEVKASIGITFSDYRARLKNKVGLNEFTVKFSRINYINSIGYWGHHTGCDNMIGLYYDYYSELGGAPQIMAVMHAELIPTRDWSKVSVGRAGSKKTSNTSLSSTGIEKFMRNPVVVRNHPSYLSGLRRIGLTI